MGSIKDALVWGKSSSTASGMFKIGGTHNDRTAPGGSDFGGTDISLGGKGDAHQNMQPYQTVYFWQRTA